MWQGMPQPETPVPNSHNTSIADAVLSMLALRQNGCVMDRGSRAHSEAGFWLCESKHALFVHAGMPSVETPAPSSHDTSIADAVMGLPDILRARSAQLVGSLELGAPLGRGSYGKVYKGEPYLGLAGHCSLNSREIRDIYKGGLYVAFSRQERPE